MPVDPGKSRIAAADDAGTLARLARFFWGERALSVLALAAVAGFAISAYLTSVHFASVPLFCSTTGVVNCAAVTSSAYSVVPFTQIPITIPGMLFFAASAGLAAVGLRCAWAGLAEPSRLRVAHVALGAAGLLFVLYLVFAEIALLRKICEWCTAVHLLT
ncbi:MAG TPA: vitamin K epoxide reductase family protein, partial [Ktedonobacterales bacterium]